MSDRERTIWCIWCDDVVMELVDEVVYHEVEGRGWPHKSEHYKCPECGELMCTSEQMDVIMKAFKEYRYGVA